MRLDVTSRFLAENIYINIIVKFNSHKCPAQFPFFTRATIPAMFRTALLRRLHWWLIAWLLLSLLGALTLARLALGDLREAFETDARIVHRVLSQRVVQHDAVLATLSLLQTAQGVAGEQRLGSVYSQILGVARRAEGEAWPDAQLSAAEAASRQTKQAVLARQDFAQGRYVLVLAGSPASHALSIGVREMLPWAEWPVDPQTSPMRVELQHAGQAFVVQPGRAVPGGWQFSFEKHLAAASQPFNVVATRNVAVSDLPWGRMLVWCLLTALVVAGAYQWRAQRAERRRAEELLRLGQVARLNSLGELAAGMAHELNQPLTAVLANTQAARRMLADEPPELDTAREAMTQAVEQARRASDVVGRLRRVVERPDAGAQRLAVDLAQSVRSVLYLLEPECSRRSVQVDVSVDTACTVMAEPVALEQIIHNLVMNALQALEQVPAAQRSLRIALRAEGTRGVLTLADSGPGIPPEVLPRIFEPFFSTREGGLGLGLSLCETLAVGMGGELRAAQGSPQGTVFTLSLPLEVAA
jgi:signal transduction histidine kinase